MKRGRMKMLNALKIAIAKQELYLTYQPIFDLKTKKMIGMEALVRWQHPEWGLISPDTFIPVAEKEGLIDKIGIWVLKSVCKQAKRWHDAGFNNFTISINISSLQLLQKNLSTLIKKILEKTKLSPTTLIFEITETSVMPHLSVSEFEITDSSLSEHLSVSEQVLKEIHELGIGIALDDFGTGHSSLVYLSRLPIIAFKIDKSFIQGLPTNANNAIIVHSLVKLAKDLGLTVTAEGIEDETHLKFLTDINCPHGQGYFLSIPLAATEMTVLLKNTYELINRDKL